jgi:dihydrofolate reductase
LEERER